MTEPKKGKACLSSTLNACKQLNVGYIMNLDSAQIKLKNFLNFKTRQKYRDTILA